MINNFRLSFYIIINSICTFMTFYSANIIFKFVFFFLVRTDALYLLPLFCILHTFLVGLKIIPFENTLAVVGVNQGRSILCRPFKTDNHSQSRFHQVSMKIRSEIKSSFENFNLILNTSTFFWRNRIRLRNKRGTDFGLAATIHPIT